MHFKLYVTFLDSFDFRVCFSYYSQTHSFFFKVFVHVVFNLSYSFLLLVRHIIPASVDLTNVITIP